MPKVSEKQSKLDKHRNTIYRLYITENKALPQVIDIMKRDHGLSASDKQYKRYFKLWGFEKNYKTGEMIAMLKIQKKRLGEGKKTVFFNDNGEKIPKIKFTRFLNRHKLTDFQDEELQEVETPRGITYKTPEPEDIKQRQRNHPSTDRTGERAHTEEEVISQSSQSNSRDNIQHEHYQLPAWPSSSLTIWSESHNADFARNIDSPAPSVYSMSTTIYAPTATMAAYTSNYYGQFETNFSPLSTAISDPGEYQFSTRFRQGSILSMPPLDLNHSRVDLFTNAAPSPALSVSTLNTTIGCFTPSMKAYAPSEQRSAHAMGPFPQLTSTRNSAAMTNSVTASGQFEERSVTLDGPRLTIPTPSSLFNRQEAHNRPCCNTFISSGRPALSLNTAFGPGTPTYALDNASAVSIPLYSPRHSDGQLAANVSVLPALQLNGSGPSSAYGQEEALRVGSEQYNYTGIYDYLPTYNVNNTYSPTLQPYTVGTEQYPSYNSNNSCTAGYQEGNGVGGSLDFGTQSTARGHDFTSMGQVNTLNNSVVSSPTALAREALATMNSMESGSCFEHEPDGYSGGEVFR